MKFLLLTGELQEKFVEFCMGIRGFPVTYDPFFKKIFNPYIHPDRFSMFLTDVLEMPLKVKSVLPNDNESVHNISIRRDAWLKFLSSDNPKDIVQIIQKYPCFTELYEEINLFRKNPRELIGLFSEALRIMDANTVQLMIEEQRDQIEAQKKELEAGKREIEAQKGEIEAKDKEILALKEKLALLEK